MNRALILHHSRTGTTAAFGNEIATELSRKEIPAKVLPLHRAGNVQIEEADTVFLGCWTSGLFFFAQKPEKIWIESIKQLPSLKNKEIILFTTFKILTGSMFREMRRHLPDDANVSIVKLKSRNGRLTESNKQLLSLLTNDCRATDTWPAFMEVATSQYH